MNNRKRQYISLLLLAVYAFFFASNNFFYHSHILADTKIVHSHLWDGKAHSHTTAQIQAIDIFNAAVYDKGDTVVVPQLLAEHHMEKKQAYLSCTLLTPAVKAYTLRGPPTLTIFI